LEDRPKHRRPRQTGVCTAADYDGTNDEIQGTTLRLCTAWFSRIIAARIVELTVRRAGLVLRWVAVRGYTVLVFNQATQTNSSWPFLRR